MPFLFTLLLQIFWWTDGVSSDLRPGDVRSARFFSLGDFFRTFLTWLEGLWNPKVAQDMVKPDWQWPVTLFTFFGQPGPGIHEPSNYLCTWKLPFRVLTWSYSNENPHKREWKTLNKRENDGRLCWEWNLIAQGQKGLRMIIFRLIINVEINNGCWDV